MYTKGDLRDEARQRAKKAKSERAEKRAGASGNAPRPVGTTPAERVRPCDHLGDLLASGEYRRLVVRYDDGGGATFTLAAVLALPKGPLGVYMHGYVDLAEMLPEVLDDLLQKGEWREDRFWSQERP